MACLGLHHTARISVPNGSLACAAEADLMLSSAARLCGRGLYLATLMPEDSTISSFTDGACYGFEIQVRNPVPRCRPEDSVSSRGLLDFFS